MITEPATPLIAVIDSVSGVPCTPGGGYAHVAGNWRYSVCWYDFNG